MRYIKLFEDVQYDKYVQQFSEYCEQVLDLNVKLGKEYYYNSLSSCVIDSVYSIGISYAQTRKAVERYNEFFGLKIYRDGDKFPPKEQQDSIIDLIERTENITTMKMATDVYKNKCRTSTHGNNSILKSEAVLLFAKILNKFGINYLQDVQKFIGNSELEEEIKKIPGQGTGISLDYFFMLAGDETYVKMDRMMIRFFKSAINYVPNKYEIRKIIIDSVNLLKDKYSHLNPRLLDHQLWLYQKDIKNK